MGLLPLELASGTLSCYVTVDMWRHSRPIPPLRLPCHAAWTEHLELIMRAQRQKEKSKHMLIYLTESTVNKVHLAQPEEMLFQGYR